MSKAELSIAVGEEIILRHELGARDAVSIHRKWLMVIFMIATVLVVQAGAVAGFTFLIYTLGHRTEVLAVLAVYLFVALPLSVYQFAWMASMVGWSVPLSRQEILRPGELEVRSFFRTRVYPLKGAEICEQKKGYIGLVNVTVRSERGKATLYGLTPKELGILNAYYDAASAS